MRKARIVLAVFGWFAASPALAAVYAGTCATAPEAQWMTEAAIKAKIAEEAQAGGPIQNPIEMGITHEHAIEMLKGVPGYAKLFDAAFPSDKEPITMHSLRSRIGDNERDSEAIVAFGSHSLEWSSRPRIFIDLAQSDPAKMESRSLGGRAAPEGENT